MLKLRRGTVVSAHPLTVEVGGEHRSAWADETLIGPVEVGDEVVVNTQARELGLGSGGFDVVHVNLSRGLFGSDDDGVHVMKLNYTSLQHPVDPVEIEHGEPELGPKPPVVVLALHGQLAPVAWAAAQARPGLRGGVVQHESISVIGALDAAARRLGWEAVITGPGPGILGSATRFGHGGMAALDAAHAAISLGLPTLVSPRLSSSDPRPRHRGLSHHSAAVLELLLAPVRVPVPEAELEGWPLLGDAPEGGSARAALDSLIEICGGRHDLAVELVDLDGYAASGLPTTTMDRPIDDDPLFFAAALAAGRALAAATEGA
jgi:hypothetical protein